MIKEGENVKKFTKTVSKSAQEKLNLNRFKIRGRSDTGKVVVKLKMGGIFIAQFFIVKMIKKKNDFLIFFC